MYGIWFINSMWLGQRFKVLLNLKRKKVWLIQLELVRTTRIQFEFIILKTELNWIKLNWLWLMVELTQVFIILWIEPEAGLKPDPTRPTCTPAMHSFSFLSALMPLNGCQGPSTKLPTQLLSAWLRNGLSHAASSTFPGAFIVVNKAVS